MNVEGMVGMLNYRPDGITPYMLFFKDGVISEKCVSTLQNVKLKCLVCILCVAACARLVNKSVKRQTSNKMSNPNCWSRGIVHCFCPELE